MQLPIIEEFYTIQGEGFHTGKAAYFIRIGGCDIGCSWCDSKASWIYEDEHITQISDVAERAESFPAKAVVVTGGEPLLYNLDELCFELKKKGIQTFIETSGAYAFSGNWDWICLSPKKQNPPLDEAFTMADELKVIIHDESDLIWAEENARKTTKWCKLFLQPEWSKYKKLIGFIVDYVKENPKWNISLQSHKFMKIP